MVKTGDIVKVKVVEVDLARQRIALTMKLDAQPAKGGDTFDDSSVANVSRYLGAIAQVVGNIYQLTRSRDLAMRDDLTKAFNRRFFEAYLDEEIERSRRYGSVFSIIFLDLDDLKMVNNFYGHLTGSRTLQEVAKRILAA